MSTEATLIADSISADGDRLTTFEVTIWRPMLAEFNTHRVFSRNSASSRAIPLARQVERIQADTAMPVKWASEQPGMSGGDEIADIPGAERIWRRARDSAAFRATELGQMGVHKSIANRLIEPFMWHTIVVTASSYRNFFGLRCSPNAQPEIRLAAEKMKALFDASTPKLLGPFGWHLPYIGDAEIEQAEEWVDATEGVRETLGLTRVLIRMSSARCAAVSYLRHADWRDVGKDMGLYEKLTSSDPMHASPLEHVATPDAENKHEVKVRSSESGHSKVLVLPRYGNFVGWHQHRVDVEVDRDYQSFS